MIHLLYFIIFLFKYLAAALALVDRPDVDAEQIVRKAMKIAGDICVYTNHNVLLEKIDPSAPAVITTGSSTSEGTSNTSTSSSISI